MAQQTLTVTEAARRLGVTINYVYLLLRAGRIEAEKVNKIWRLSATGVEQLAQRRATEGAGNAAR